MEQKEDKEDKCHFDLGYIQIIKSEQIVYKNDNNIELSVDSNQLIDENIRKFYAFIELKEKKAFICKYNDCQHMEIDEHLIVSHIEAHLNCQQIAKTESSGSHLLANNKSQSNGLMTENNERSSDRMTNSMTEYVCDWKGCGERFTHWTPLENHLTDHKIQELLEDDAKSGLTYGLSEEAFNEIKEDIKIIDKNGRQLFVCKNCNFNSYSIRVISRHIRSERLSLSSQSLKSEVIDESDEYEKQLSVNKRAKHKRKHSNTSLNTLKSPNKSKATQISLSNSRKTYDKTLTPITKYESNDNIEISNNENISVSLNTNGFLSCKGLGSAAKVAKYLDKRVINGQKVYYCKWNGCQYSTKRSQEFAQHINFIHIGCRFRCHKPNCNKVFKTVQSWRAHQKNHICNYSLYGSQKFVIGVCRNANLDKYWEKTVIDGRRYYSCKCCQFSSHSRGIRRHVHNQHVCPHRVNLKLKTNINVGNDSNPQNDLELNNNKFVCKRAQCRKRFAVYSDLLKHENLLCNYKKNKNVTDMQNDRKLVFKNRQNEGISSLSLFSSEDYCNTQTSKPNELIESKTYAEKKTNKDNSLESVSNFDKYLATKTINGVEYHLCIDCKFMTKKFNKIVEHIETQHLRHGLQSIVSQEKKNTQQSDGKRKISFESPENPNQYQKIDSIKKTQVQANKSIEKDLISSTTDKKIETNDKLSQYYEMKRIDGEPNYFCKWKECKYYANSLKQIKEHINESHIRFTCHELNCHKSFQSEQSLRFHEINHICGFGIIGRKSVGVCDLDNVRKYRNEVKVGDKYVYSCKWSGCGFVSENKNSSLFHIHNRHICPNRGLTISQNAETNKLEQSSGQPLSHQKHYTCKRPKCSEKFNSRPDLLKHENLLCKYKTFTKSNVKRNNTSDISRLPPLTRNSPKKLDAMEMIGSFGPQSSTCIKNFAKYSKIVSRDGKLVFVCIYPNCNVNPRNSREPKSYSSNEKRSMIKHIGLHCGEKPFVC